MNRNFKKSVEMLERAERVIPLGSQTFSKSKTQFAIGSSPLFVTHGKGSRIWDVDGNEYIDYINSLAAVILGYDDPDVRKAVDAQMKNGVVFSLPTPLETELAEELRGLFPCAEMARFGKNGSDATAGAIRVARAHTGRDRVAVCGYHGWQDWYIGSTTRNKGVPQAVRDLTHTFQYNNPASLHDLFKKYPGEFAAVIMEPMGAVDPVPGFHQEIQDLCRKNGTLLVFDEVVSGFRYHMGGAQSMLGVTPDLAAIGKSMANGFPVSAVIGKAEYMHEMEEIFFSFTFGGETISITAALATIRKMKRENVVDALWASGEILMRGVKECVKRHGLEDALEVGGKPCWQILMFKDARGINLWDIKSLFLQEMFARGILIIGTHNMSFAHTAEDIKATLAAYDEVLGIVADALKRNAVASMLKASPVRPLFSVR